MPDLCLESVIFEIKKLLTLVKEKNRFGDEERRLMTDCLSVTNPKILRSNRLMAAVNLSFSFRTHQS